jgi:hypothetical protein
VKCGRRAAGVELAVAAYGLVRRQCLDLDAALPQPLERLRVGTHLRVRARAYNQPLRQLIDDVLQVGKDESVPIGSPPVGEHAVWEDDHVTDLLLAVDDEVTEAVVLDSRHRLTSDHRFVLSILAPVGRPKTPAARERDWDTRVGSIELAVPKLREGSYFPDWLLQPRRRAEQAFVSVIADASLAGRRTRTKP